MESAISLSELQLVIRDSLYTALPGMYWIAAEISEIKENYAGHCYLDLAEKEKDNDNIKARARAIIWNNRYRLVKSYFENITGEALRAGLKILVKVKVEYHELYGLSLVISDIDPSYSIGDMAVKRQQIITRLQKEGVFEMNRELIVPEVPLRIAVISSSSAAGYSDFVKHLEQNSFGYRFRLMLFESAMQGADTEKGITGALDAIASSDSEFDVVAVIRGGGAQSDLGWFDNYNIAYHITQFPLPVLTGIGHEKDMSVTDLVANKALRTPTAVAGFLIDTVARFETRLADIYEEIKDIAGSLIDENRMHLESLRTRTAFAARSATSSRSVFLSSLRTRLMQSSGYVLRSAGERCSSYASKLEILRPEKVLQRGYTLTSHKGKILKSADGLKQGDKLDTLFFDGSAKSVIEEIKANG